MDKLRVTASNISQLEPNQIFVFGSNKKGLHYGGAAKLAVEKFGALMGQGHGPQGNCFAIDSMSGIKELEWNVEMFLIYAMNNEQLTFLVTEIGCGIAGFKPEQIAPLFKNAMNMQNVHLPQSFWNILNK